MDIIVLGRNIGTASGWDAVTDWDIQFYDFVSDHPNLKEFSSKGYTLYINYVDGRVSIYGNGEVLKEMDFINDIVFVDGVRELV